MSRGHPWFHATHMPTQELELFAYLAIICGFNHICVESIYYCLATLDPMIIADRCPVSICDSHREDINHTEIIYLYNSHNVVSH